MVSGGRKHLIEGGFLRVRDEVERRNFEFWVVLKGVREVKFDEGLRVNKVAIFGHSSLGIGNSQSKGFVCRSVDDLYDELMIF